eukprot:scaffold17488_cov39-Cyclotella_meneghiniana.AAC.3
MNRTKHGKVLSALEKRALRYKNQFSREELRDGDEIDERGTVATEGLTDEDTVNSNSSGEEKCRAEILQQEMLEASGVSDDVLKVHGVAPASKPDGVFWLVYENCNGLLNKISDNN